MPQAIRIGGCASPDKHCLRKRLLPAESAPHPANRSDHSRVLDGERFRHRCPLTVSARRTMPTWPVWTRLPQLELRLRTRRREDPPGEIFLRRRTWCVRLAGSAVDSTHRDAGNRASILVVGSPQQRRISRLLPGMRVSCPAHKPGRANTQTTSRAGQRKARAWQKLRRTTACPLHHACLRMWRGARLRYRR